MNKWREMSKNDTSINLNEVFDIKWNENENMNIYDCRSGMLGESGCITVENGDGE